MAAIMKLGKISFMAKLFAPAALLLGAALNAQDAKKTVLQVGHFPNISHAQALVAHQLSRQGKGWFEERLGPDVTIEWRLYNAGPTAMEALFTGSLDITYVGPSPALNAYSKTREMDIRILAGSADGGAALVVNPKLNITKAEDFRGKKIGTPQLGNTQDVAARAWLIENGLKITLTGGDAQIIPTANPEQLPLFKQGMLDAVWTVEPWVTRLEKEAGGKVFLEQKEAITTVVATCNRVLRQHPELVRKFVQAHNELTEWIIKNPVEAQELARKELEALTGGKISEELVKSAWPRLIFTTKVNVPELKKFVGYAYECGFIKKKIDITNLVSGAQQ